MSNASASLTNFPSIAEKGSKNSGAEDSFFERFINHKCHSDNCQKRVFDPVQRDNFAEIVAGQKMTPMIWLLHILCVCVCGCDAINRSATCTMFFYTFFGLLGSWMGKKPGKRESCAPQTKVCRFAPVLFGAEPNAFTSLLLQLSNVDPLLVLPGVYSPHSSPTHRPSKDNSFCEQAVTKTMLITAEGYTYVPYV